MNDHREYAGIDYFRLAAAFLVVAVHTSPLADISGTGDFIVSRVIARIAVPFFFATSGFFTVSRYDYRAERLAAFAKRTARIYLAATLLYIPVNVYQGYFQMEDLLPNILKDLVFDGTFYHLWYLPASVLGAGIAWQLLRKMSCRRALMVAFGLYLIGLFGDSYYGISEGIPWLKGFYGLIFQVSDYTRNGVFFAPIFFVIGGWMAESGHRILARRSLCGFGISLLLMLAEALTLHRLDLQRHDSMYVFLPLCMYFLFDAILHVRGRRPAGLGRLSLFIYLIHPMMILVVRLFAKLSHLQNVLVENSAVHYLIVCLISAVFGIGATAFWERCKPKKAEHATETDRAYIEIDLESLVHNARVLQSAMPPECRLMAVVKAGAYGHGDFWVCTCLEKIGVEAFAVATIDEGIRLRRYGIRGEILILGYTGSHRARDLKKYGLMQTLVDLAHARELNGQGVTVKVHIKIDTGMHRLGIPCDDLADVRQVFGMEHIRVCGIYTHLCCPDSQAPDDVTFTEEQIDRFYHMVDALREDGIEIPRLHIQSSYGFWNYPEPRCDYIRAGIALYGVFSAKDDSARQTLDLRPVLALKARVALVRSVREGESVGYGRSFTAERDSRIAILPIGYGDGVPRDLSCGKGGVLIRGQYAPIAGKVCMDQLAVDVTDIEGVSVGDTATLISPERASILSAPAVAGRADSISNELLCRLGERLPVTVAASE